MPQFIAGGFFFIGFVLLLWGYQYVPRALDPMKTTTGPWGLLFGAGSICCVIGLIILVLVQ